MAESNHQPIIKFNTTNYPAWLKCLQMNFTALELTPIVDGSEPIPTDPTKQAPWLKKDANAQRYIYSSVDKGSQHLMDECKTSKEMMEKNERSS